MVKLFADRKIHTLDGAKKTIRMLDSKNKATNIKCMQRLEHHDEQVHASELHEVFRFNYKRPALQNYLVTGRVEMDSTYSKTRTSGKKWRSKEYKDEIVNWWKTTEAVSKKQAAEQYRDGYG